MSEASSDTTDHGVRVLIIDDHTIVALGLRSLIEDEPGVLVVGIADSVRDGLELTRKTQPDVILVDYRLPDGTGADVVRQLGAVDGAPRAVMVTSAADRGVLAQALDAGCIGFLSKNAARADVIGAIRAAATNTPYFTGDVLRHLAYVRRFERVEGEELSARELEVLQLTANGLSSGEIAARLYLSEHTVKNHIRHAMEKLEVHTKLDAVVAALRARLISIE